MTTDPAAVPVGPRARTAGLIWLVALLAAATWCAWFAWDTRYQYGPDGVASGPYSTWQGVGAALTMLVLTIAGALRLGARPTALAATTGFTVAFSVTASSGDDTGLWLVGALLVAAGVGVGTALVAWLTTRLRRSRS